MEWKRNGTINGLIYSELHQALWMSPDVHDRVNRIPADDGYNDHFTFSVHHSRM